VFKTDVSASSASNVDQQEQEASEDETLHRDDAHVREGMECDQQQQDDPPLGDLYSNDLGLWPVDSVFLLNKRQCRVSAH